MAGQSVDKWRSIVSTWLIVFKNGSQMVGDKQRRDKSLIAKRFWNIARESLMRAAGSTRPCCSGPYVRVSVNIFA